MMKNTELVTRAIDIARNHKTTYIWGGIGNPITEATVQRAEKQYSKNISKGYARAARKLIGKNAFYFDCVGLIKSILWGWNGDPNKSYGGAKYATNGVPDIGADAMIRRCSGVSSTDWVNMVPGEVLWMPGHIGIYIGGGLAVEATPSWNNGVQISAVKNIGNKAGYNARKWTKHGKLPWVEYPAASVSTTTKPAAGGGNTVTVKLNVLKRGDKGAQVKAAQALLVGAGYKLDLDSSFGPATQTAVKKFQAAKGIAQSGMVDEKTWGKLLGE